MELEYRREEEQDQEELRKWEEDRWLFSLLKAFNHDYDRFKAYLNKIGYDKEAPHEEKEKLLTGAWAKVSLEQNQESESSEDEADAVSVSQNQKEPGSIQEASLSLSSDSSVPGRSSHDKVIDPVQLRINRFKEKLKEEEAKPENKDKPDLKLKLLLEEADRVEQEFHFYSHMAHKKERARGQDSDDWKYAMVLKEEIIKGIYPIMKATGLEVLEEYRKLMESEARRYNLKTVQAMREVISPVLLRAPDYEARNAELWKHLAKKENRSLFTVFPILADESLNSELHTFFLKKHKYKTYRFFFKGRGFRKRAYSDKRRNEEALKSLQMHIAEILENINDLIGEIKDESTGNKIFDPLWHSDLILERVKEKSGGSHGSALYNIINHQSKYHRYSSGILPWILY